MAFAFAAARHTFSVAKAEFYVLVLRLSELHLRVRIRNPWTTVCLGRYSEKTELPAAHLVCTTLSIQPYPVSLKHTSDMAGSSFRCFRVITASSPTVICGRLPGRFDAMVCPSGTASSASSASLCHQKYLHCLIRCPAAISRKLFPQSPTPCVFAHCLH
jgi:hypothetical protein